MRFTNPALIDVSDARPSWRVVFHSKHGLSENIIADADGA